MIAYDAASVGAVLPDMVVQRNLTRALKRYAVDRPDGWEFTISRPRRWVIGHGVFVGLALTGIAQGLASVWRGWFYWLALTLAAALVAGVTWWHRRNASSIACDATQLTIRRLGHEPVTVALDAIRRVTLTSGTRRRLSFGHGVDSFYSVTPWDDVELERSDGTTIGFAHSPLAQELTDRLEVARPTLVASRLRGNEPSAQRATIEVGNMAAIIRAGNARGGLLLLAWWLALAAVGFAGVVGWIAARPEVRATDDSASTAQLVTLAGTVRPKLPVANRAEVQRCVNDGEVPPWDGDAVNHQLLWVPAGSMVNVEIEGLADRAAQAGMLEREINATENAALPDRQWDLPAGSIMMRLAAYRPRTTSESWKASLVIQTPCLRGTSANPAALQATNELAAFILKQSK
jgi:hypothetical protein